MVVDVCMEFIHKCRQARVLRSHITVAPYCADGCDGRYDRPSNIETRVSGVSSCMLASMFFVLHDCKNWMAASVVQPCFPPAAKRRETHGNARGYEIFGKEGEKGSEKIAVR